MTWQRSNIQAAAAYLRDQMAVGAANARARAVYEGLLDVLEPARRTLRIQREGAAAAKAAVVVAAPRERRSGHDRRGHQDRRLVNLGPPGGVERRSGRGRRTGKDRRDGRS